MSTSLKSGGAAHVALWDAINALVDASGGRNGVSIARMTAVAKVESALCAALAEAEGAEPVAFPPSMRREVERQIAAIENPAGMQLNDGKERPILPAGTLRRMLAVIDSRPPSRNSLEPSLEPSPTSDDVKA